MPELPEVEILARNLRPQVTSEKIIEVKILRPRSVWGTHAKRFAKEIKGQRIVSLTRRAKYLRFELEGDRAFLVHLGMTGRLFVSKAKKRATDKHDVAHFCLSKGTLVFHDTRKFGHLALGDESLRDLGPEPLAEDFTVDHLAGQLAVSRAPIKPRLLDQQLVAGIGNIYACEILWRARINPRTACRRLSRGQVRSLHKSIVQTLHDAIWFGGGLSLNFGTDGKDDGIFYYGSGARRNDPAEHFDVYDREGKPCRRCRGVIERITQGGRSTFYCPRCQANSR